MPRVTHQSRVQNRTGAITSPFKSPVKIPLNDDKNEKAARLQSRQALQEIQLNQIRAATSPARKTVQYDQLAKDGIVTPEGRRIRGNENGDSWAAMTTNAMTPMKRVPILANFEEWMKMATDNKINATNSWNFALIDYFHDMSLLKEGDSVNFQKASCTLDGCVKIYTSRVDSVATETGKLLSGLADSGNKKKGNLHMDAEDENAEDVGDGEEPSKLKKKSLRSSESTLATSFSQLQIKKFELELSVDPLFKKASADFDEGGAKGLLLNHLCIDNSGRIVFDSSDDTDGLGEGDLNNAANTQDDKTRQGEIERSYVEDQLNTPDVDLRDLRCAFFPDLSIVDEQDICPSLKNLDLAESMDFSSLSVLQAQRGKDVMMQATVTQAEDDIGLLALGSDEVLEPGLVPEFGTGGDIWAQEAGLDAGIATGDDIPMTSDVQGATADDNGANRDVTVFGIGMQFSERDHANANILSYFDNTLKANWAGPEHWRIRRMKRNIAPRDVTKRKERDPFEIDFQSPLSQKLVEQLYTSAASSSVISLPRTHWRSRTRHLLPNDKHFNSSHLLRLFLKPKACLNRKGLSRSWKATPGSGGEMKHVEDAFWTKAQRPAEEPIKSGYDADFFREDDTVFPLGLLDENSADEFSDAREALSPESGKEQRPPQSAGTDAEPAVLAGIGYGSSLVTQSRRLRPEYVSYAKVAKKVDVRLLKEKMWKGIGFEGLSPIQKPKYDPITKAATASSKLSFTTVMNNLQNVYTSEAMADISTSYCFISLLHLANEKGLILNNDQGLEELSIMRDMTADPSAAA